MKQRNKKYQSRRIRAPTNLEETSDNRSAILQLVRTYSLLPSYKKTAFKKREKLLQSWKRNQPKQQ